MPEYIEKEAAIEKTEAFCDTFVTKWTDEKVIAWIKKLPTADVAPMVPELRVAVRLLYKQYESAKKNPIVRNPVAYALYQTWKAVEDCKN